MSGIPGQTSSAFWLAIVLCGTDTHTPTLSYSRKELPSEDLSQKTATIIK